MTDTVYQIAKKALLKLKAEVKSSPAAGKKFLEDSGLGDVLENAPIRQTVVAGKADRKKVPA